MKSSVCLCMCVSVGRSVHCKCFLAYPVWLLNCLNQSCRWSDLRLARLWCETISPGPWGPPTVKPTSLPNPVDAARIHVHPTDHTHVVMGRLKFFFLGVAGCQLVWILNYFQSPLVRAGIAAGAFLLTARTHCKSDVIKLVSLCGLHLRDESSIS